MCFFGFGRFLPQFRGGALGGKFATFALFFATPAPKAARRDPGAPPASKCSQNDPKWSPKCSKMLSCWTPFGFVFRNVVSSCFAQRKAQKKIGERSVLFCVKKTERSAGRVPARRTVGPPLEKKWRAFPPLFRQEKAALRRQSTRPGCCASQVAGRRSLVVGRRSRQKGTN